MQYDFLFIFVPENLYERINVLVVIRYAVAAIEMYMSNTELLL